MAFAESIVDLVKYSGQFAAAVAAEIDAERIEPVTEDARHAKQLDLAIPGIDAGRRQQIVDLQTQWPSAAVAVIRIMKADDIGPIV